MITFTVTSLHQARALPLHLLSTLPFHPHSRISHRRLLVAIPSHPPIRPTHRQTLMMLGTSFPIMSHGVMSTKSIAQAYCRAQKVIASSCVPLRRYATSAPRKPAKNVVSAKQRCVTLIIPSLLTAAETFAFLSVPEPGLRVPVVHRVITFVNMRPKLHPRLRTPQRLAVHDARHENPRTRTRTRSPHLTIVSRLRCPNSCHFIIPITQSHTGRAPLPAMIVQWRNHGNFTGGCSQIPLTIPLRDSHPSVYPI